MKITHATLISNFILTVVFSLISTVLLAQVTPLVLTYNGDRSTLKYTQSISTGADGSSFFHIVLQNHYLENDSLSRDVLAIWNTRASIFCNGEFAAKPELDSVIVVADGKDTVTGKRMSWTSVEVYGASGRLICDART